MHTSQCQTTITQGLKSNIVILCGEGTLLHVCRFNSTKPSHSIPSLPYCSGEIKAQFLSSCNSSSNSLHGHHDDLLMEETLHILRADPIPGTLDGISLELSELHLCLAGVMLGSDWALISHITFQKVSHVAADSNNRHHHLLIKLSPF